jgi:hypothetical protein
LGAVGMPAVAMRWVSPERLPLLTAGVRWVSPERLGPSAGVGLA